MQDLKIMQECSIMCSSGANKILQCFSQSNIQVVIYSTHIDFNGLVIGHDRNATAYLVHFTPDSTYAIIWVRNPNAIEVINLKNKNADVYVVRNLEDDGSRIIAATMQVEGETKPGHNTRKLYFILQQRGNVCLRVIQFQPKVENNPKTRMRVIEENVNNQGGYPMKAEVVFSANRWNMFIIIRKQIMRVCRPVNRNNDIEFDFAIQAMEPKLLQLCSGSNIVAIAESSKTWGLLCGNNPASRTDCNMALNIFRQHYFGNELVRYMYYRDQSYVKSVSLPCSEKDFMHMWQVSGYYLIETVSRGQQGQNSSGHFVHVVAEEAGMDVVTFEITRNSKVCWKSLIVNSQEVSICEIVNENQLNKIRIFQGPSQNAQNTKSNNVASNVSQQIIQPNNKQGIKKFEPVQQEKSSEVVKQIDNPFNQTKISADPTKQTQQGKATAKKNQSIDKLQSGQTSNQNNAIKALINEKLVQHLTSGNQNGSNGDESELEAPQIMQSNISFGAPSQSNKNKAKPKQNANTSLMSFGAPLAKQSKPNNALISFGEPSTANPTPGQKQSLNNMSTASTNNTKAVSPSPSNQSSPSVDKKTQSQPPVVKIPKFSKQQVKGLLNEYKAIQTKYLTSINEHFDVLRENYQNINFNELVKFEPLFSRDQLSKLKNVEKGVKIFQTIKQRKLHRQFMVSFKCKNANNRFKQICAVAQKRLRILQISLYESSSQLQSLRKLINKHQKHKKTLSQHMQCELRSIATNILQLSNQSQLTKQYYRVELQKQKQKQKSKKMRTKDMFQMLNEQKKSKTKQTKNAKEFRVPICRFVSNINMVPLIKLTPL